MAPKAKLRRSLETVTMSDQAPRSIAKVTEQTRGPRIVIAVASVMLVLFFSLLLAPLRQAHVHSTEHVPQGNTTFTSQDTVELEQAATQGDATRVRQLLMLAGSTRETPKRKATLSLELAVEYGHASVVRALLEHGVSTEPVGGSVAPLVRATSHGHVEVVRLLLGHGAATEAFDSSQGGATSLIFATESGDVTLVNTLLEHRASPDTADSNGMTPLLAAVRMGHSEIVSALLVAGASTSMRQIALPQYKDSFGVLQRKLPHLECLKAAHQGAFTPLFLATVSGYGEVVSSLLQHRPGEAADTCVLALAAWQGNAEVVALMLDHLPSQVSPTISIGSSTSGAVQHAEPNSDQLSSRGNSWIADLCTRLSMPAVSAEHGLDVASLPATAVVYECVPRNHSHGGVLVVTEFLSSTEAEAFGEFVSVLLDGRASTGFQSSPGASMFESADDTYEQTLAFWPVRHRNSTSYPRSQLLNKIGGRLLGCPGAPPPFPKGVLLHRPTTSYELLQLSSYRSRRQPIPSDARYILPQTERTGRTEPVFAMHHDRNKKLPRFATVIAYLSSEPSRDSSEPVTHRRVATDGGHTIFPFLAGGGRGGPGEQARQKLLSLAAAEMQSKPSDLFWDSPPIQEAIRSLCEEVRQAEMKGEPPPCIAVAPTPGTAVIFFNWARRHGGPVPAGAFEDLQAEWRNVHIGCPAYRTRKHAVQSFREIPADLPLDISALPVIG